MNENDEKVIGPDAWTLGGAHFTYGSLTTVKMGYTVTGTLVTEDGREQQVTIKDCQIVSYLIVGGQDDG